MDEFSDTKQGETEKVDSNQGDLFAQPLEESSSQGATAEQAPDTESSEVVENAEAIQPAAEQTSETPIESAPQAPKPRVSTFALTPTDGAVRWYGLTPEPAPPVQSSATAAAAATAAADAIAAPTAASTGESTVSTPIFTFKMPTIQIPTKWIAAGVAVFVVVVGIIASVAVSDANANVASLKKQVVSEKHTSDNLTSQLNSAISSAAAASQTKDAKINDQQAQLTTKNECITAYQAFENDQIDQNLNAVIADAKKIRDIQDCEPK